MNDLGRRLLELCKEARRELVLAAPFVKAPVLARILAETRSEVQVTLVTRWRVEEILAGVSDLEVWDLLANRAHSRLLLAPDLHAKYYRADTRCLVGSANLTERALGWSVPFNIELLLSCDPAHPELAAFEAELLRVAAPVTASMALEMVELIRALAREMPTHREPWFDEVPEHLPTYDSVRASWIPSLRHPEDLFTAYVGRAEQLTSASRKAAYEDLRVLRPPAGLSEPAFRAAIAAAMLQLPAILELDVFLEQPQRFGAVTQRLREIVGRSRPDLDVDFAWQTLMRWLLYFLPERYELTVPNYSEVFGRRR